jgi:hypothetical protein
VNFKLKDIKPNPYRDLLRFPVQVIKVAALVRSIKATGFWPTLIGRIVNGYPEIAFGHNRLAALREVYGPNHEIPITIEERTDADFIKMMELENSEEYGNDVSSTIQSVRSVVTAFAAGVVELPAVSSKANTSQLRFAPSFVRGRCHDNLSSHPYTAVSLAVFFECEQAYKDRVDAPPKIEAALAALELEEMKITGFDSKSLDRLRTPDGKLPVKRVLDATKSLEVRAAKVTVNEKANAAAAKLAGETLQEQLDRAKKDEKDREKELKKLSDQYLEATRKEDEEKAARLKQEMIDKNKARKAEAVKLKQAQKEWDKNQKERQQSADAQRQEKENAAKRAEAMRTSSIKALIDECDRRATNEDALFDKMKITGRDKRTTDVERKLIIDALEEMSERVLQLRVFIRPELAKKR